MSAIHERLQVEAEAAGQRLDRWITDALQELDYAVSRSQVQRWIEDGHVTGPRRRIKPAEPVEPGEWYEVTIPAPEPVTLAAEDIPLDVVFEDDHVIVVNKSRGMVVHPGAGHDTGTVVNALLGRGTPLSQLGGQWRPGVVHRIDKDTSGLIMFAKTDLAYHALTEQLHDHSVERLYLAVAHGVLTHDVGTVDAPIGRDPRHRQRMAVTAGGKRAVTHFRVLERFAEYTYLELRLETGRTHQIRVHLAYIGHPLAGDPLYGRRHTLPIEGQALHAAVLGFTHPVSGTRLHFEAPLPEDMRFLIDGLRSGVLG